jgi:alpha-tubulin suppressor-like RCC1 family protein
MILDMPLTRASTVHDGNKTLEQYASIRSLLSDGSPSHTFSISPKIAQLVAYETGFAALSSTGQVWTWGDERYTACLGREPTQDR